MKHRRTLRTLARSLGVLIFALGGWIAHQEWVFRSEEPLRDGIHAWETGDNATAWKNLLPFAKTGDRRAQRIIAFMYAFGSGVPIDTVRAQMWSRRAECGRYTPGAIEYDIAYEYLNGVDPHGRPDAGQAVEWFRRAAEAGHPEAQRLMASPERLSEKGLGVDPQLGRYWQDVLATDGKQAGGSN